MQKGMIVIGAAAALISSANAWALKPVEERDLLAQRAVAALAAQQNEAKLQDSLSKHTDGLSFASFLDIAGSAPNTRAISELHMDTAEVWVQQGAQFGTPTLVAYRPAGDEASWTHIPAYDLDGNKVSLDVNEEPFETVLVIENRGGLAMMENVDRANELLREMGLQYQAPEVSKAKSFNELQNEDTRAGSVVTTRLDRIRLKDDEEPWILGKAEIYAITAGVFDNNRANIQIVGMPYLDHKDTTYYPRQIVLDWRNYDFAAANVLIYEQDDNTSYQTLVSVIVQAIGQIGSLAGVPAINAIATITNTIVEALPSSFFTNDDDFVDAYYTLERDRNYRGLRGARNNANADWSRFVLSN